MLSPRLTNCVECVTIPNLITEIDCKLTELAKAQYNNLVFSVNNYIPTTVVGDLIVYRRVLTYKYCNPDYAMNFSIGKIASRVKVLIHK